jgi:hypothetical protein
MDNVSLTEYLLAFAGLSIMWLSHLRRSRLKNKELFSWAKYWHANWDLILTCLISTVALLYVTGYFMEIFKIDKDADNIVAFAGGLINLKIVNYIKTKVTDKIRTR